MKIGSTCFAVLIFQLLEFATAAPTVTLSNQTLSDNETLSDNLTLICSDEILLSDIKKIVEDVTPGIKHLGEIPAYAATSCQQIAALRPIIKSGYYWIQEPTQPTLVYCQMNDAPFGEEGVWMKIGDVNMTKASPTCPSGLEKVSTPKSLCRKKVDHGCSSVTFSTHSIPYKKVCGRVIGYQRHSPDAFNLLLCQSVTHC